MRSRPTVKVMLNPPVLTPGDTLFAETVLNVLSETPVDFVKLRLRGETRIGVGEGKYRVVYNGLFYDRFWQSEPMKMFRGELKLPTKFEMPRTVPPAYYGADTIVTYTLNVHVSIPWWPDRIVDFNVPMTLAPAPPPDTLPGTFATSREGPRGKAPFMDVSLDTVLLSVGDVLSGSVSIQNLHGRRVKGITLSFVESETLSQPRAAWRIGRKFTLRVFDGAPPEGVAIPFRVRLPDSASVTMGELGHSPCAPFSVATAVELRAEVAWGDDVSLNIPIKVFPRANAPRRATGWIAPVGRERQLAVWRTSGAKFNLTTDDQGERMTGQRGAVTVAITTEHRENDFWLIAQLGFPNLGLDLDIAERKWSDALSVDVIKSGDESVDARFAVHAREPMQARALLTTSLLRPLMPFEDVTVTDTGAVLALRGAPHAEAKLEPFLTQVMAVATLFDGAAQSIPPPALFAADVPAWEAFAARLRGRLERGRMWIHDGQVGQDVVEMGAVWERRGLHLGTLVRIAIDPPLETVPRELIDPSLSPAARDAWRELQSRSKSITINANAIEIELEGKVADPQVAMPILDLVVTLRRALAGTIAAGPFR